MQILDNQGRLFGKVNIIDAAVLVVVCLLIPLAYGAYLLFRIPDARITAVEPARVPLGTEQIVVRGENLRPYLRITIGTQDTLRPREEIFLFENPDRGALKLLPSLTPGTYDVVLYDELQELGRLRGGLVIDEPRRPDSGGELMAIGAFRGLDTEGARAISQTLQTAMKTAPTWGQVAGFRSPEPNVEYLRPSALAVSDGLSQVRAVLRLRCTLEPGECRVRNIPLVPGAIIPIAVRDRMDNFVVDELHPVYTNRVELQVRAVLAPETAELLRARQRQSDDFPARDALRPSLVSSDVVGATTNGMRTVLLHLSVPAVRTPDAWRYRTAALRVGDEFEFEGPLYQMRGLIVSVTPR